MNDEHLEQHSKENNEAKHGVPGQPDERGFPIMFDAPSIEFIENLAENEDVEYDRVMCVIIRPAHVAIRFHTLISTIGAEPTSSSVQENEQHD